MVVPDDGETAGEWASSNAIGHIRRVAICVLLASISLSLACAAALQPRPWTEFYNPRYPDHRAAYELCDAGTNDARAFSHCMQEQVVPFPERDRRRAEPGWMHR